MPWDYRSQVPKIAPKDLTKFIVAYAPNNEAEVGRNEDYGELKNILGKPGEREIDILIGGFNAKVGNVNSGFYAIMGQHGIGTRNENGQMFADFCANNLVIGGSLFEYKEA